jgi:hypothetical protein
LAILVKETRNLLESFFRGLAALKALDQVLAHPRVFFIVRECRYEQVTESLVKDAEFLRLGQHFLISYLRLSIGDESHDAFLATKLAVNRVKGHFGTPTE